MKKLTARDVDFVDNRKKGVMGVGKSGKEKEGGLGRPRKYSTALSFRRAVEGYFRSITRTVTVKDTDTGMALLNDDEEPVRVPEYVVPPSFTDMLLWLGISKKTWCNYANGDNADVAWVCDRAKARIEAYLERELMTRQKGVQGIIFNLSSNYAWREKREIEVGTETRKALAATSMTMEEKMELIKAAASEAAADGVPAQSMIVWGEEERSQRLSPGASVGARQSGFRDDEAAAAEAGDGPEED